MHTACVCVFELALTLFVLQSLTVSALAVKALSQWRSRYAHVWRAGEKTTLRRGGDDDEPRDERKPSDLADQLLRDLRRKHASLDPGAAEVPPALARAAAIVERLADVLGDAEGDDEPAPAPAPAVAAAAAAAHDANIAMMRYDLPGDDPGVLEAMAKRLRDVMPVPPEVKPTPVAATRAGAAVDVPPVGEIPFDDAPSPDLNDEQNAALGIVMRWLRADHAYRCVISKSQCTVCDCVYRSCKRMSCRTDPKHAPAPGPLNLLVHGSAGTGTLGAVVVSCALTDVDSRQNDVCS